MKKFYVLYLHALKVKSYFAFMLFVQELIDKFSVIGERFCHYADQFKAAFDNLNQIFLKYDQTFYTKAVQEADAERDAALVRLNNAIRSVVLCPESAEKGEAGEFLLKIVSLYGGSQIVNQKMNDQTASIVNLVEDLEEKYPDKVELIGIGRFIDDLKQAQRHFDEVYMERVEYDSEIGKRAMAEARRRMDKAYRELLSIIELEAQFDSEGLLTPFIRMMNVEISRYRTITGQGQVGSSSGDTGLDEDGAVIVRMSTVTFKFNKGTEQRFKAEVGSALVAPQNTEGYRWEPKVPATMPEKNTTFKEVPVQTAEAVATFHFADHREEEIRQIVGTILTAPANTEGYYWQPEVPATMPEEDTSYYELPEEGNGGSGSDTEDSDNSEEHDYEYVNPDKLDPAQNITIEWLTEYKGTPIKKMIVPLDGQVTQDDVPDCPTAGYVWNHGVQDINRQISNNGFAGKVISCYPYDPDDMGVRK